MREALVFEDHPTRPGECQEHREPLGDASQADQETCNAPGDAPAVVDRSAVCWPAVVDPKQALVCLAAPLV